MKVIAKGSNKQRIKEIESIKKEFYDKLKESEEKYRNIINNISDVIGELDLRGNFTYISPQVYDILGFKPEEIVGNHVSKVLHPEDVSIVENTHREIMKSKHQMSTEFRVRTKNGDFIPVLLNSNLIKVKGECRFLGAIRDITERKEAEKELRASKDQLNERIKELDCIYNLSKLLEEPNITLEALIQGLLYLIPPAMQFPDISFVKIIYNDREYMTDNYKDLNWKITSMISSYENDLIIEVGYIENKEFLKEEINLLNEIEHRFKLFIEQKEIEKEIKKSEEKHRRIIQTIREGYYEVDLKGNYTYINNGFSKLIEYSKDEVLGISYRKLMDESTAENVFKEFISVYNTGIGTKDLQFTFTTKSGAIIDVESSVEIKYDSKGSKIGFFGLVRDITQRKKLDDLMIEVAEHLDEEVESRTKELRDTLKEKDQFLIQILKTSQFKTQFLATMSHELRTPLNAIIGFTDLLLEGVLGSITDVQREYIEDIKGSADHQFNMIQKILDISKIESGQMILDKKVFSVRSIVDQVISNFKLLLDEKNLNLEVIGMENDKEIYADAIRFKEILINLVSNAIKYTIQGDIKIIITENLDSWIFKVKDTGIGIAEKDFNKIFKEFQRVTSPYVQSVPGTGLGLSLTKRLVNLHGGTINFDSKLDVGAIFTFMIPKKTI